MLIQGRPDDPVWMVIDDDVVPGRLVEIRPSTDAGPSGLRCIVRYSGPYGGSEREDVPRTCSLASVDADAEWNAPKAVATMGRP